MTPTSGRRPPFPTTLKLRIREIPNTTPLCWEPELQIIDASGERHQTFQPFSPKISLSEYASALFKKIDRLLLEAEEHPERVDLQLEDLGSSLGRRLLSPELHQALASHISRETDTERVCFLQILSDEPWIPWELVRIEDHFLCEAFALSRWLWNIPQFRHLPITRIAVVAPMDSKLPRREEDAHDLAKLAGSGRSVEPITARLEPVREALHDWAYEGWHFIGHGGDRGGAVTGSPLRLEGSDKLLPLNLPGPSAREQRVRPLAFLNICHSGRGETALTGVGGWAEAFLTAGAGAFMGALWTIVDDSASLFSQAFYRALFASVPIAEAVRQARLAIRKKGDPTWLAYTLFAHPQARCTASASEHEGEPTTPASRAASPRLQLQIEGGRATLLSGSHTLHQAKSSLDLETERQIWRLARELRLAIPEAGHLHRELDAQTALFWTPLHERQIEAGLALSKAFLDEAMATHVRHALAEAVARNEALGLAVDVHDRELADLPWEALCLQPEGPSPSESPNIEQAEPLVLHPRLDFFRGTERESAAIDGIPGPLRILVAIGSPEVQNERLELLDMERELASILDAVEPARRQGNAHVRILERGTVQAIYETLQRERFHVLHISCHALAGRLILEDEQGGEDIVDAERLWSAALPAGRGTPVLVLAGCATAVAGDGQGDPLPSLGRTLWERGIPAVLAMRSSVTDRYATQLTAELYRMLATAEWPDILAAVSQARRRLEMTRRRDAPRSPAEWSTPVLFLRTHGTSAFPLFDPQMPAELPPRPRQTRLADGVVVRRVGDFVGRRWDQRVLLAALRSPDIGGIIIHGLGGVGKSTLAAHLVHVLREDDWRVVSWEGEVTPDDLLDTLGRRLTAWAHAAGSAPHDQERQLAQELRRSDLDWETRFDLAADYLDQRPILLLLDNFEDNLHFTTAGETRLHNAELGRILARWLAQPGRSRLLLTSRHPIELGDPRSATRIHWHHLGPLSWAETRKLIWRLPALDALSEDRQALAWEVLGGHPRSLEYLDALLRSGDARFADVTKRLQAALADQGIEQPDRSSPLHRRQKTLETHLAETVTLAANDVLLEELLARVRKKPLALRLLQGAAVYRIPVRREALVWQLSGPSALPRDEDEAPRPEPPPGFETACEILDRLGLLSPFEVSSDQDRRFLVHRFTAQAVEASSQPDERRGAHRSASRYWRWQMKERTGSSFLEAGLEARFHHLHADELEIAVEITADIFTHLHRAGAYQRERQLCIQTLPWLEDLPDQEVRFFHQLCQIAMRRSLLKEAEDWARRALEISIQHRFEAGQASSLYYLGRICYLEQDYEKAQVLLAQALEIRQRLGREEDQASTRFLIGMIAEKKGRFQQALEHYEKSLEIYERLGKRKSAAHCYGQLGVLAQRRGDFDRAESWYEKARAVLEELDIPTGLAIVYHQLGTVLQERKDIPAALTYYHKAIRYHEKLGDRSGLSLSYHQLGLVEHQQGHLDEALSWYRAALEIDELLGTKSGIATGLYQLGRVAEDRHDLGRALDWYQKSLKVREELGDPAGIALNLNQIGYVLTVRGDAVAGLQHTLRSLTIRRQIGIEQLDRNFEYLNIQRERLGDEQFRQLLEKELADREVVSWVYRRLQEWARPNDQ